MKVPVTRKMGLEHFFGPMELPINLYLLDSFMFASILVMLADSISVILSRI